MDKNLEEITSIVCKEIALESDLKKMNNFFKMVPVENYKDIVSGYEEYVFSDIIVFIKIGKLFDYGIIDNEAKNRLIDNYKEYNRIGKLLAKGSYNRVTDNDEEYARLKGISNNLFVTLNAYGLFGKFDFKEAIMDQIDKDVKSKIKKRKRNNIS